MDKLLPYLESFHEHWWIAGVIIPIVAVLLSKLRGSGDAPSRPRPHPPVTDPRPPVATAPARISDMPPEQATQHVEGFLERVGRQVGDGRTLVKKNDRDVEWRGEYQGVPIRIRVESGSDLEMEAKVTNPRGLLSFYWDPDVVEEAARNDAWSDEDDVYVFVGPAVYVTGTPEETEEELAALKTYPAEAIQAVIQRLSEGHLCYWHINESRVSLGFNKAIDDIPEAETRVAHAAQLLGWFVQVVQGTPLDPALAPATPSVSPAGSMTADCSYCQVRFLWSGDHRCPNCGAPVQGA